jgi:hypothetical protein
MSMDMPGGYLGQSDYLSRPRISNAKAAPLPQNWKPGDALPAGTVGMAPMTGAQEQAIQWAETRPTASDIVDPVRDRLADSQRRSDIAWGASNLVLDKGAQLAADDPSIADPIRARAAEYAMRHGMDAQRANNEWEKDRTRISAISADPRGAEMYERYKLGQIPGFQITSDPSISPYFKKLVAEEPIGRNPARYGNIVREGTASRRGMSADYLESEADRQIGGVVDRMVRGGGNKAMRSAMQAYARAIRETTKYAPGTKEHEDALDAETEASLKVQQSMGGMLAKFEDRMGREGGDVVKGSAWGMVDRAIRDRVQGALGQAQQPGMAPQQQPQTRPQSPTRGTRGQQEPPTTPVVRKTLSNQTVEQFATPEVYFATVMSGKYTPPPGGAIQVGKEVYLPGLNYKPDGSTTPTLRPAIALGDYYVSDPRSFAGKNSAEQKAAWAAQLTDDERRDLFRAFVVEGADSTLPAEIRKQLRAVYRSRLGVNTSPLSEKDQSQALMGLKAREDDVLYAALVGFPGAREPRFQGEIEAPEEVPTSGGRGGSSRPVVGGKPAPKFTKPGIDPMTKQPDPNAEPVEVKMPNFESVWKQLSEDQQMEFNTVLNMLRDDMGTEFPAESLAVWERRMSEIRSSDIQSSDLIDKMFDPILQEVKVLRPDGTRIRSMREVRAWMNGDRSSVGTGLSQSPTSSTSQSVLTKPTQPAPPAADDRTTAAISAAQKHAAAMAAIKNRFGEEKLEVFTRAFPTPDEYANATKQQLDAILNQLRQ